MHDDQYTWGTWCAAVKGFLTVDAARRGAEGFVDGMIRQAAIDLQTFLAVYRIGHETMYWPGDFVKEGYASKAVLPPQAEVKDAWLCDTSAGVRYPMKDCSWMSRVSLVTGNVPLNDRNGRICIDSYGYTFYAYPAIEEPFALSLFWDGLKLDFKDDESVPFDEPSALAAAEFVKGKLAREVDRDINMHNSYMQSYFLKRGDLYITAKRRTRIQR